jgi:Putative lumazine-binding
MTAPKLAPSDQYIADYDAILKTMDFYIAGLRAGDGKMMSQAFLPDATMSGYYPDVLQTGSMQKIFGWVDQNGPAPNLVTRFARVEILGTIAEVRLEVDTWSGEIGGPNGVRMSDLFTLAKSEAGWKIAHKAFHVHSA